MSRGLKITLIILGILFALIATCAGGGYYWWTQNGDDLINSAKASGEEGAAFGAEQESAEACIDEGLRRISQCGRMQISCVTSSQMFTQACFSGAPADPALCEGVPDPQKIMDSVSYTTEQCKARDMASNQYCPNVFSALQAHCAQTR
jgi:hypothetical protein